MRRYLILLASVVIQMCLGGTYAWSVFVPALSRDHGLSNAQTQIIFGVTIGLLSLSMVFAGRLQERRGPRLVAGIGAALYACGYLLAAHSRGEFAWLLVGIGFLAGTGIGFAYVCPLATLVKWFPERKGLITGVAVAGYGAGAILLSTLAAVLFGRGLSVLEVFRLIGFAYGSVVFLGAMTLSVPPALSEEPRSAGVCPAGLLRCREFSALVVGMFTGTFAGVTVIGNLKPIGLSGGVSAVAATAAISALAVGNTLGRISWGALYDRWGRPVIPLSLLFLGAAVLALLAGHARAVGLLVTSVLVGLGYGACLVLYAARIAAVWGPGEVGNIYPLVMLFHGAAALIGPPIGGALFDATGSYAAPLLLSTALAGLGALLVWLTGLTRKQQAETIVSHVTEYLEEEV